MGIFNAAIFNNAIFNTSGTAPPAPDDDRVAPSGSQFARYGRDSFARRYTDEERREAERLERIRLGILDAEPEGDPRPLTLAEKQALDVAAEEVAERVTILLSDIATAGSKERERLQQELRAAQEIAELIEAKRNAEIRALMFAAQVERDMVMVLAVVATLQ